MPRSTRIGISLLLTTLLFLSVGCGGGGATVSEGQMSPEAQKADDAGQKAMEDFMREQMQKKR